MSNDPIVERKRLFCEFLAGLVALTRDDNDVAIPGQSESRSDRGTSVDVYDV
ncbi:MAG: hypothetical protein QOF16_1205, partial [Actinomycetota bacterium]|nr:hypothetical protein [Actinomycetota bacterium]